MGKLKGRAVRDDEEASTGPRPRRLSDMWDHKASRERRKNKFLRIDKAGDAPVGSLDVKATVSRKKG
jgi:hypothetical protein